MPHRDAKTICKALAELKKFFIYFGHSDFTRIRPLEQFMRRLQEERLTIALINEIERFKDEVLIQTRDQIRGGRLIPGPHHSEEGTTKEFHRVCLILADAFHPQEPPWPRMDVRGFSGSEFVKGKETTYQGDSSQVRGVFEGTVAIVRRHAQAVVRGDFQAAYEDIAPSFRTSMTMKRFVAAHTAASRKYGGAPMDYQIYGVGMVLADDQAREKSTNIGGWPKATSKAARRSILHGFWIRDTEQHGCDGAFWISEEAGAYRIAKFDFATL